MWNFHERICDNTAWRSPSNHLYNQFHSLVYKYPYKPIFSLTYTRCCQVDCCTSILLLRLKITSVLYKNPSNKQFIKATDVLPNDGKTSKRSNERFVGYVYRVPRKVHTSKILHVLADRNRSKHILHMVDVVWLTSIHQEAITLNPDVRKLESTAK